METIVVTGAAGAVGSRTCRRLADEDGVTAVLGLDVRPSVPTHQRIVAHQTDLRRDDLKPLFEGASAIVHLASSFRPSRDGIAPSNDEIESARAVLEAAGAVGVRRVVILSSAMVYGAWPTNPMPLIEDLPVRPNREFAFGSVKAEIETMAMQWLDEHPGSTIVVLRPTTALAQGEASWVSRSLRAAALIDAGESDPPVQFLHLDDLAQAVALAARGDLSGVYNVAPDGWVDGETCRELGGRVPRLRLAEDQADRLGRFSWRHRLAPTPPGLTPYTVHPWVISNDRLRAAGWEPTFTNEEAYVDGTPPKPWATLNAKRRQQIAMGAAAVIGAVVTLGIATLVRRLRRG